MAIEYDVLNMNRKKIRKSCVLIGIASLLFISKNTAELHSSKNSQKPQTVTAREYFPVTTLFNTLIDTSF